MSKSAYSCMYLVPIDIYNKLLDVIDEREKRKIDDLNRNEVGNENGAFPNLPPPPIMHDPGTSPIAYDDSDDGNRPHFQHQRFSPDVDLPSGEELEINQGFDNADILNRNERVIDSAEVRARLMGAHSDADSDEDMTNLQRNKRLLERNAQAGNSTEGPAPKHVNPLQPVNPGKGSNPRKGKSLEGHKGGRNAHAKSSKKLLLTPDIIGEHFDVVESALRLAPLPNVTIERSHPAPTPVIPPTQVGIPQAARVSSRNDGAIPKLAIAQSGIPQASYASARNEQAIPSTQVSIPQAAYAPNRNGRSIPPDNDDLISFLEERDEAMPVEFSRENNSHTEQCSVCSKKLPKDLITRHEVICLEYRERILRQRQFLKDNKKPGSKKADVKRGNAGEEDLSKKSKKQLSVLPSDDEDMPSTPRIDLTCVYCKKNFNSPQDRKKHEVSCALLNPRPQQESSSAGVNIAECRFCPMTFNKTDALHRHVLLAHNADKNYKSLINQGIKRNAEKAGLPDRGKKKKKPSSRLYCFLCTDSFDKYDRLVRHIKNIHQADENYVSNLVQGDKRKTDEAKLPEGGSKRKSKSRFSCQLCDTSYSTKHSLNRHIKQIHSADPNYKSDLPQGDKRKRDPPGPGHPEYYDNWN